MEMIFKNDGDQEEEGELEFPLADGATICGYAVDINGAMVEGTIVEKETAR